jgi:RNA-binding protein 39
MNGQATPFLPAKVMPLAVTEPVGNPSECLLLKDMFDPATEVGVL